MKFEEICTSTIYSVHACTLSASGKNTASRGGGVLPFRCFKAISRKECV